ncbi:MAG: Gfo/Idh/MocA family oxidoreductase [Clostridia bacterium]|nr:Gfo/Idh/MocA family oxidoreductase [Clostridia bacterium]
MIRIGLSGVGRMGSYHLAVYEKLMREGFPVKVVAVCDVDKTRLDGSKVTLSNLAGEKGNISAYNQYTDIDEMLRNEELDAVDVIMPTYLHCDAAVKVLESGRHCMCEKPMALDREQCDRMIKASERNGKTLMIGHCLRFWREYVYLKEVTEKSVYGACLKASFWRGGYQDHVNSPSWEDWIITREKGGGGLFDQHIHDADCIRWLFGDPEYLSAIGKTVFPKSANDIVSTNYGYDDKIVYAHDDITYKGYPFGYGFTVSFEHGTLEYKDNVLTVYPEEGDPFKPELSSYGETEDAYYNELKYFLTCLLENTFPERCHPADSACAVDLVTAETTSADNKGKIISYK